MQKFYNNKNKKLNQKLVNNFQFEEFQEQQLEEHVFGTQTVISRSYYRFFLDKEIEEESKYRGLIQALMNAEEGDIIELIINNVGGSLTTTISIMNAIRTSSAFVPGIIMSQAHSGAGFISLVCDTLTALPNSCMLIHNPRGGNGGNFNEVISSNAFYEKFIKNFYFDIYKDFLTEEEIQGVLDGKDIWLTSEEINNRIEIRNKKQQEKENNCKKDIEDCEECFETCKYSIPENNLDISKEVKIEYRPEDVAFKSSKGDLNG